MSNSHQPVNVSRNGMGCITFFLVLLQILFLGLKLTNHIDWSWWLVLMPLIFYVGWAIVVIIGTLLVVGIVADYMRKNP